MMNKGFWLEWTAAECFVFLGFVNNLRSIADEETAVMELLNVNLHLSVCSAYARHFVAFTHHILSSTMAITRRSAQTALVLSASWCMTVCVLQFIMVGHYLPFTGRQDTEGDRLTMQFYFDIIWEQLPEYPMPGELLVFFIEINTTQMCLYHEMTSGCGIATLTMRQKLWELEREKEGQPVSKSYKKLASEAHKLMSLSPADQAQKLTKKAHSGSVGYAAGILGEIDKPLRKPILQLMERDDREAIKAAMEIPDKMQEYLTEANPLVVSHTRQACNPHCTTCSPSQFLDCESFQVGHPDSSHVCIPYYTPLLHT